MECPNCKCKKSRVICDKCGVSINEVNPYTQLVGDLFDFCQENEGIETLIIKDPKSGEEQELNVKAILEQFPEGKLNDDDEGELQLAIGVDPRQNIVIDFGKQVSWLGFPKGDAIMFAETILQHANSIPSPEEIVPDNDEVITPEVINPGGDVVLK
tara:strand:- start:390 stop:857 length:468 start_codon:yes stop_codon:yes gene_type:complete